MARGRPAPNPTCVCGHSRHHHLRQGRYTATSCDVVEPTTGACTCKQFKIPAPAGLTTPAESIARAQEVIDDARAVLPTDPFAHVRKVVDEGVSSFMRERLDQQPPFDPTISYGDSCPSPTAKGRHDRCGLFASPQRCTPDTCMMRDAVDDPPPTSDEVHGGVQISARWWECSSCHDAVDVGAGGMGAAHTHQLFECPKRAGHTPSPSEALRLNIVDGMPSRLPAPATLPVPPPPPTVYEPPPPPPPSAARAERLRLLDQIEQAEAYHASLGRAYQVENEKLGAAIASERAASRMLIDARRSLDEAREQLARSIGAHQVLPVSVSAETLRLASQGS